MPFNKELTRREKALLMVLAVLILVYCYFFLIHMPISNRMTELNGQIQDTETQITALQGLQGRMQMMQSELELHKDEAPIPDYDNLEQVIAFLHTVLPATTKYDFSYTAPTPVTEGRSVGSRTLTVSFEADSYKTARTIVNQLENGPYRCQVTPLDISSEKYLEAGKVSVGLTVTFFENLPAAPAPAEPVESAEPAA